MATPSANPPYEPSPRPTANPTPAPPLAKASSDPPGFSLPKPPNAAPPATSPSSVAKATYMQTKDLLHKTTDMAREVHDNNQSTCHDRVAARLAAAKIHAPTPDEVMRYRWHHGVNLASCFVLEKWLTPSMYVQGADTSELAAVTASCNQFGHVTTRQKWEAHWATMISDTDFDWLVHVARCTSIRLPIGYWVLGATCTKGTPFEQFSPVYLGAWSAVKKLVSRAKVRGIGTLIDFHGLPGGANAGDHSGTNNGKAELWSSTAYMDLATHCVLLLTQDLSRMDGIIGLQICNEALFKASNLYEWYDHTLGALALIDPRIPIYISDAWDLATAIRYAQSKNTVPSTTTTAAPTNPIIIDSHYYWTFADADKSKTPQQVIADVPSKLSELEGKDSNVVENGACSVITGEYSCAMDEQSWSLAAPNDRPQLTIQFGQAQTKRWQQRSFGAYFWTYKMDWMDGGEWGFVQQTKTLAITAPQTSVLLARDVQSRIGTAQNARAAKLKAAVEAHISYWSKREPEKTFEHWRHETGWSVGFTDAMAFFGMKSSGAFDTVVTGGRKMSVGVGGDKIGSLDLWVRKRILDSGMVGPFVWEFETGLRQGVQDFHEAAGI